MSLILPPRSRGKQIGALKIEIGAISDMEKVDHAMVRVHFPKTKKSGILLRPLNHLRNSLSNSVEYVIKGSVKEFKAYIEEVKFLVVQIISDLTMKPMGSSLIPLESNAIAYLHDHYPIVQDDSLLGQVEVIVKSNFFEEFDYPIQGKAVNLEIQRTAQKVLKIPRKKLRKIENPNPDQVQVLDVEVSISTLTVVGDTKLINPKCFELALKIQEANITHVIQHKGGKDTLYKFFDDSCHRIARSFIDSNMDTLTLDLQLWTGANDIDMILLGRGQIPWKEVLNYQDFSQPLEMVKESGEIVGYLGIMIDVIEATEQVATIFDQSPERQPEEHEIEEVAELEPFEDVTDKLKEIRDSIEFAAANDEMQKEYSKDQEDEIIDILNKGRNNEETKEENESEAQEKLGEEQDDELSPSQASPENKTMNETGIEEEQETLDPYELHQLVLLLENGYQIQLRANKALRNLFFTYTLSGQDFRSPVYFDYNETHFFDHRIIIPIYNKDLTALRAMKLDIWVWDKVDVGNDYYIGKLGIPMSGLQTGIDEPIYDDYCPITTADSDIIGYVKVCLMLGKGSKLYKSRQTRESPAKPTHLPRAQPEDTTVDPSHNLQVARQDLTLRGIVLSTLSEIYKFSYKGYILPKNLTQVLEVNGADSAQCQNLVINIIQRYQNSIARKLWVDDLLDYFNLSNNPEPVAQPVPKKLLPPNEPEEKRQILKPKPNIAEMVNSQMASGSISYSSMRNRFKTLNK